MDKTSGIFKIMPSRQVDVKLVLVMRHGTTAKILTVLAQNNQVMHGDLAWNLGISSQALTWQMNQLEKTGLINAETEASMSITV
jgi:predicted ArsR family transcriptional regulator